MIRIVIELPKTQKRRSEKEAVWEFRQWLTKMKFCPLKIDFWGVKEFNRVHAAENIKKRKAKNA